MKAPVSSVLRLQRSVRFALLFLLAVGLSSCGIFEDGVDDRAPGVQILTPFDGAELGGGSVRFRVQAQTLGSETDNFISFVTLSLDGQQIGEAEPVSNADGVSTFVLGWNSFDVPDGEYILEAVAFDRFDARGLSAPVRVVVNNDGLDNTSSLNVEIVSPVDRAEVAGLVRVIAESTNQLGPAVTKMDLLLDGITIDTDASAPFIFEWNAASSFTGFRTLRVRAFVDDDTFVYSEPVFVTVVEAGEDPDPSPGDVAFRGAGIDGQVFGSAGVGFNNDIYVGSDSDTLYSFSQDGALQWKFGTRGPIRSSPVIANNEDIFVTSEDGRLYALNASGRQIWPSYTTNAQFRATPALGIDGTLYVGDTNGRLHAVNSFNGFSVWDAPVRVSNAPIVASAVIDDDRTIYVGSTDGFVYAYDITGTLLWRTDTNIGSIRTGMALSEIETTLTLPNGTTRTVETTVLYAVTDQNFLYAIAGDDGSIRWQQRVAGPLRSGTIVGSDGTVYVGTSTGLMAVNENGGLRFIFPAEDVGSPVIDSEDNIYFMTEQTLRSVNPNGTPNFELLIGAFADGPLTINRRGQLIFAATDRLLYAVETEGNGLSRDGWPMFQKNERHTGNTAIR